MFDLRKRFEKLDLSPAAALTKAKTVSVAPARTVSMQQAKPVAIQQPKANYSAINQGLNSGRSWEDISRQTGTDLNTVKSYSQQTRPNYGISGPKVQSAPKLTMTQPRQTLTIAQPKQPTMTIGKVQQPRMTIQKTDIQNFLDQNGDTKLYSGRSANDYIRDYNSGDAWKQQKIRDELTKKSMRSLDFGDTKTVNERDEASTLLASLKERGKDKFDLFESAAELGNNIVSSTASGLSTVSDAVQANGLAINMPKELQGKTTMTLIQDAYNKGRIDKQTYIDKINETNNRLDTVTGGASNKNTFDQALRTGALGFDLATTAVPFGSLAKGTTALAKGTKLLSGQGLKQAGVYAGKETLLNAATATPGALMRNGVNFDPMAAASEIGLSAAAGGLMSGTGVVGGSAYRAAKNGITDNIVAATDKRLAHAENYSGLTRNQFNALKDNEAFTLGDYGEYLGRTYLTDTANPRVISDINKISLQARHAAQNAGLDITSGSRRDVQDRIANYLEKRDLFKQGYKEAGEGGFQQVPFGKEPDAPLNPKSVDPTAALKAELSGKKNYDQKPADYVVKYIQDNPDIRYNQQYADAIAKDLGDMTPAQKANLDTEVYLAQQEVRRLKDVARSEKLTKDGYQLLDPKNAKQIIQDAKDRGVKLEVVRRTDGNITSGTETTKVYKPVIDQAGNPFIADPRATKKGIRADSAEYMDNPMYYKEVPSKSSTPTPQVGKPEVPKTVKIFTKSKFNPESKGGYADYPVIRQEDNITLYQGTNPGENRQFWTPNKKYAEQFGSVREKTGSFYQVDNGNRMTDVYVEAPSKPVAQPKPEVAQPKPVAQPKVEVPKTPPELKQTFYKGFKKDGTSTGSGQGDAFYMSPYKHIAKTYDEGVGVKSYKLADDVKAIDWKDPTYKAVQEKHMLQVPGGEPGYRRPDFNAINKELKSMGYDVVTSKNPDGTMPQIAVINKAKVIETPVAQPKPEAPKQPTPFEKSLEQAGIVPKKNATNKASLKASKETAVSREGSRAPGENKPQAVSDASTYTQLNTNRIDLSKEAKSRIAKETSEVVKKLSNNEIKDMAKSAGIDFKSYGVEGTRKKITEQLNVRNEIFTIEKQIETARKAGNKELQVELMQKSAELGRISRSQGTDLGRQLQARRIIADSLATPQQKLYRLFDEAGVDPEVYTKRMADVDMTKPNEVVKAYRDLVPAKFSDWLDKYRYTNMLSSPLTHIVNITSNLSGLGGIAPVQKLVEGAIDATRSAVTGAQRTRFASEAGSYVAGAVKSVPEAVRKFRAIMSGKQAIDMPDADALKYGKLANKGVAGVADSVFSVIPKLLEASDQFGMTLVKGGEKAGLQKRMSKGVAVAKDLTGLVEDKAKYRLFRQELNASGQGHLLDAVDFIPSMILQARNSKNKVVSTIAKFTIPFVTTPTNLFKQGIEYSPAGLLTLSGNSDKVAQLAKMTMGTSVMAVAAATLASQDAISFSEPSDAKQRDAFRAEGKQPYSIKVGDKWIQYSKLHPAIAFNLALVGGTKDALDKGAIDQPTADKVLSVGGGVLGFFRDQSYMKSIGDFTSALELKDGAQLEDSIGSVGSNWANQLVPFKSMTSWVGRMVDPTQRKIDYTADAPTQIYQNMVKDIPGLNKNVPTRNNPYYKDQDVPLESPNPILNSFSPLRVSNDLGYGNTTGLNMTERREMSKMPDADKESFRVNSINQKYLDKVAKEKNSEGSTASTTKNTSKPDTGWTDEYNAAKSTYDKESKNWTEIQRVGKEKELKTLEVKKNFSKDATRLYDMAEKDIYAYLEKSDDKKASDYLNQVVAYGDKMVEAGLWTTNKLRDKNGNVQYKRGYTGSTGGSRTTSRSSSAKTGSSSSSTKKGKFDYKLNMFSDSTRSSGSAADLYALLRKATMKG